MQRETRNSIRALCLAPANRMPHGHLQKIPMSGNSDMGFAIMKVHHQQAVDMAQTELSLGKSAAMKAMARQIIAAQKKEVAQFDRWLAKTE